MKKNFFEKLIQEEKKPDLNRFILIGQIFTTMTCILGLIIYLKLTPNFDFRHHIIYISSITIASALAYIVYVHKLSKYKINISMKKK